MSGHGYRYVGNGDQWQGVPARDLTQDEFEELGPLQQRAVTEGGGYKAIAPPAPKKPATPKRKSSKAAAPKPPAEPQQEASTEAAADAQKGAE